MFLRVYYVLKGLLSLYSAITLSVPDRASVAKGSGLVQVCATLSDVPAGGYAVAIDIMLATSDGMIVVFNEWYK